MYAEIPTAYFLYDVTLYDQPQGRATRVLNLMFGVYNRNLTKKQAFRHFEHLANAIHQPIDIYQPLHLQEPSLFQVNFLGLKLLSMTVELYQPLLLRYGYIFAMRDALRIWAALAERDLPWDVTHVTEMVEQFRLLNPFDGQPYTVDGQGRLQLLPSDDVRWEQILGRSFKSNFPSSRMVPPPDVPTENGK